jgi:hypothetical protein
VTEAEDGEKDYEGLIVIFSFNLHFSGSRKNFGDSAEKAKVTEGEAKNRRRGRRSIESSHESGGMGTGAGNKNSRERIGERMEKTGE